MDYIFAKIPHGFSYYIADTYSFRASWVHSFCHLVLLLATLCPIKENCYEDCFQIRVFTGTYFCAPIIKKTRLEDYKIRTSNLFYLYCSKNVICILECIHKHLMYLFSSSKTSFIALLKFLVWNFQYNMGIHKAEKMWLYNDSHGMCGICPLTGFLTESL